MRMTRLRQRFGYCVGISAAIPIEIAKKIDAEVEELTKTWKKAGGEGRTPTQSDVLRKILCDWANWKGP